MVGMMYIHENQLHSNLLKVKLRLEVILDPVRSIGVAFDVKRLACFPVHITSTPCVAS